ncbi:MAG: DUF4914 family protein [Planctomycetaceae bacterium]|nr:DUF4914 family protein [Planctomycetaceae bacterium]
MRTINIVNDWSKLRLPGEIHSILKHAKSVEFPMNRDEVLRKAMGDSDDDTYEVAYDIPEKGRVLEATVVRARNGLAVNYADPMMRRRDPDCLVVGDSLPTDKCSYQERFGVPFDSIRTETFEWLKQQDLSVMAFILGGHAEESGQGALLICPKNAGFFLGMLADLQGMLPPDALPRNFLVNAIIYLAPPFRHTHFDGKQVVVHHRTEDIHEVFAYNLYPGPSAKKGVYGVLLNISEDNEQITLHGSTVQVVTPYDNVTTFMHEGASGSGKSEMLEYVHRQEDGRIRIGKNLVTGEERRLTLNQTCALHPVTDDMAMCLPNHHDHASPGYLTVYDAEKAWFVRVDHITHYGIDPLLESLVFHPQEPLLFLNINAVPRSTCLIWDHIEDAPGKRCPNPRVIIPRHLMPHVVNHPVDVMIRNFGLRTPPCTKEYPSYGIAGYLHILPPALAWIWRLVAPRGHANPSIVTTEGLSSEGVGSYWPFATGCMVDHANLLLRQIRNTSRVRYTLTPNQHVGAWSVSFMPQWIAREYLARRGTARFPADKLLPARCPLLGHTLKSMQVEGVTFPAWLLRVEEQPEVGSEGYDIGARQLVEFFKQELQSFLRPNLDPVGRRIIECCFSDGSVSDYEDLMPHS